jgi:DNA polymerase
VNLIVLDFETFYDSQYSLSKLTTEEYIRDPRFEALMVGIKVNDQPPRAFTGSTIEIGLHAADIPNSMVVCHHAHFDCAILNWHYGLRPKIIFDTLAMGRAAAGAVAALGGSLKNLSTYFELGTKGDTFVSMLGKRLSDMTSEEVRAYEIYCAEGEDSDVNLTYRLFQKLRPSFNLAELQLIDVTTRLFTEPVLELDGPLYAEFKEQEIARKATLIMQAGVAKEELMSNPKFAEVLMRLGVKPPMKPSPKRKDEAGRPVMTFAFAKTDDGMTDLLEHPNEFVRAVVEARLGVKTSIMETRAQRFMDMSQRGPAPIYIKYWGAEQTGRHSAGDKTNFLNLGRGKPLGAEHLGTGLGIVTPDGYAQVAKVSSDGKRLLTTRGVHELRKCHQVGLRDGLRAPKGMKIVVGDSSNIEARKVCYIAGQEDILEGYRQGVDQYCALASEIFRKPINKTDHPAERQMGKVGVLSCGFGAGYNRFIEIVQQWDFGPDKELMRPFQNDEKLIVLAHTVFRNKYYNVKATWDDYRDRVIPALAGKERVFLDRKGLMQTTSEGTILLPNGRELRYPNLRWREYTHEELAQGYGGGYQKDRRAPGQWVFDVREGKRLIPTKIYGAKLFENVVQAMARIVVMDQTVRVSRKYRVVHSVYDEIVCCVPDAQAEECEAHVKECLVTPPSWALDFPLAAETGVGQFYGAVKG